VSSRYARYPYTESATAAAKKIVAATIENTRELPEASVTDR